MERIAEKAAPLLNLPPLRSPMKPDYPEKFSRIAPHTLYPHLAPEQQQQVATWATHFALTQQELRQVCEWLRDLTMWQVTPLASAPPTPTHKKQLLASLQQQHQTLAAAGPRFAPLPQHRETTPPRTPQWLERNQLGLGNCPVASERTRCCNLLTLDMVENCGFGCSYCSIQTFYGEREVRFDRSFASKLAQLTLDPEKTYHIGTGQSSDSLMWGNSHGALQALLDFATRHPNVILELKSKSANIAHLLRAELPPNLLCTWSLNPQPVIDHEEHGTAPLAKRLEAARTLADRGVLIGFHFHPIIRYQGGEADYRALAAELQRRFTPSETALISLGTLTYIKPVLRTLRQRGTPSKILQMPLHSAAGKLSYPPEVKRELFRTLYHSFSPAWQQQVFFYLCMEEPALWQEVFGYQYPDNEHFEQAMLNHYRNAIARSSA